LAGSCVTSTVPLPCLSAVTAMTPSHAAGYMPFRGCCSLPAA
jgi:hypothetical protein